METKLPTAQEAAIGFAKRLRPQDLAEVIDFDSRVVVLQTFTSGVADLEQAIRKTSAGGSTSMYNAVYIALKDLKKVVAKNVEEIRRQAIVVLSDGEDTSSLLPFEEVLDLAKRSETAIYAIGLRVRRRAVVDLKGLQGSRVRPAAVRAGNRRPRVLPEPDVGSRERLRPDLRRAVEPVHGRLHVAEPEARRLVAPRRRAHDPAESHGADQAGILRPDALDVGPSVGTTHLNMNARSARSSTRPRSPPTPGISPGATAGVGRSATTLLVAAALAHTFIIGMQTVEAGHIPVAGRHRPSRRSCGCWPSPIFTSR